MVKHIWLNMDISIPLLLDSTSNFMLMKISFTAEVWVAVHQDHMVKYSSFEGNMPETDQTGL